MIRESREITDRGSWLSWRREHLTASRIAALFGCHPYLDRDGLAASLRGVDQGDNPSMRAGRMLEPGILAVLAEDHPDWRIRAATTYHWLPEHRLGATPDGWLGDDGLIQVKTVSPEKWDEWGHKPPLAYTLQTLTEMLVTGRAIGKLAVCIRSRSYPIYEFDVPRHPEAEARILAAAAEWWRAFDAGELAEPGSAEGLTDALDDGSVIDMGGDNELPMLLTERRAIKDSIADDTARLGVIDDAIKRKLGTARLGFLPGWRLNFSTVIAKEYTVAARQYRRLTVTATEDRE